MRKQEIIINGEGLTVLSSNLDGGGSYPKDCYLEADENGFYAKDDEKLQEKTTAEVYAQWKKDRAIAVDNITVEVDGLVFDGDELSQSRMHRAIQGLVGDEEVDWILADNSVVVVNQTIIGKAMRLAGEEQARIWVEGK